MTIPPLKEIMGVSEQECVIKPHAALGYVLLNEAGDVCATSFRARWLSNSALLCSSAKVVRWDFDLKVCENDP